MCIQTRSKQLTWHIFKVNVEFLSPVEDSLGANCQQKLRINWHSSICAVKLFLQTFISENVPSQCFQRSVFGNTGKLLGNWLHPH